MNKFWMVYVEGGRGPAHRHGSLEQAKNEAQRLLVEEHVRPPVYVLECVAVGDYQAVVWKAPDPLEDKPFLRDYDPPPVAILRRTP